MDHSIEVLHTGFVTHDVKRFVTTRPDGFDYEPGQGVETPARPLGCPIPSGPSPGPGRAPSSREGDFVESLHVALVDLGVDEDDIVLEE